MAPYERQLISRDSIDLVASNKLDKYLDVLNRSRFNDPGLLLSELHITARRYDRAENIVGGHIRAVIADKNGPKFLLQYDRKYRVWRMLRQKTLDDFIKNKAEL